jgi:regulatory protein
MASNTDSLGVPGPAGAAAIAAGEVASAGRDRPRAAGVAKAAAGHLQNCAARPGNRELVSRAIALLARREMSRTALIVRLLKDGFGRAECEAVCRWCEGRGFLDDRRHAESVALRLKDRYGAPLIATRLRQKGAGEDAIETLLRELEPSEVERAQTLLRRKFPNAAVSIADKARRARFLRRRGFAGEVVRAALAA